MDISVTLNEVLGANKLKCRARVYAHEKSTGFSIQLEGLRVIDDGVKPPWVALPQEKYMRNDEIKYKDIIKLSEVARDQIFNTIINDYKKLKESR